MATIKIDGEAQGSNSSVEVDPSTVTGGDPFVLQQIAALFDFKPSEVTLNKRKLETLVEYAKMKTSDHSPESLKHQIRRLGTKLGSSKTGESPLSYMHRFAYLELQSYKIKAERQSFLRAGKRDNN